MNAYKPLSGIYHGAAPHWVGDGFPVRTLLSYDALGQQASPFLLLDHAGPASFAPSSQRRGVGAHPHRGFQTVTIVYDGEVEHRDSAGHAGVIGPGDVQWMHAASGVLHEEMHSNAFTRRGGDFHMAQLWVNLPASLKMSPPTYQTLRRADIPRLELAGGGWVRVIAGSYQGVQGAARSATPLDVWELVLAPGTSLRLDARPDRTAMLALLRGDLELSGGERLQPDALALWGVGEGEVTLQAGAEGALALWLSGDALNEPIVGRGPFVMNSSEEIYQAMRDYGSGAFGEL